MERISILDRVDGFRRLYDGSLVNGPLVGFFYGSYYPFHRYSAGREVLPGPLDPDNLEVSRFAADYARIYDMYHDHEGDFIWSGAAFWGVPWMEALCGCNIIVDPERGSAHSEPLSDMETRDATGNYSLPPRANATSWVTTAIDFLDAVGEISAGRFPLGTTLMRGVSDLLSAVFGTPDFIYRIMDDPVAISHLVGEMTDRWIEFADAQFARIPEFHGGVGTFFYDMWLPGRGVFVQEDASALMSPELFAESILPGIIRILDHFDSAIVHLHPSSYIPIDHLLETKLLAIELHRDLGGQTVEELLPVYRRIQERKPLVIWGDLSMEELALLRDSVDTTRLAVKPVVETHEQAEEIWRLLKT